MRVLTPYILVLAAALLGAACDDRTPAAPVDETVDYVRVTPATPTLMVGDSVELTAAAVAPDGGAVDGVAVTWTVADPVAATLRVNGGRAWVRALRAGAVRIEAAAAGKKATATLSILNARPQISALNPLLVSAGSPAQGLTLLGSGWVEGAVVLWNGSVRPTTFVSATELRAHLAEIDLAAPGLVQVVVANPAPAMGASNALFFRIAPPAAEYVEVLPALATIEVGDTLQFTATVRDAHGAPIPGRTIAWASLAADVATVSASGLVTARAPGASAIRAASGSAVGAATLTVVVPEDVPHIASISPDSVPVRTDVEITILGHGFLPTTTAYFNHGHQPTAYVSATELRVSIWDDQQGTAASGPIYVVNPGPSPARSNSVPFTIASALTSVRIEQVTDALFPGESTPLVAVPLNEKGEPMASLPVTWESQYPGIASVSANGVVSAHDFGTTLIRARIGDYYSATAISVVAPPASYDLVFDAPVLGVQELWTLRLDGGQRTRLMPGVWAEDAAVSTDGARIAYVGRDASGNRDIWVADRDGTNRRRLTTDAQIDDQPAWSPDGTKIAFRSWRAGIGEIWIMNDDGSDQRRLTSGVYAGTPVFERPTFTSDGMRVAYAYGDAGMTPLRASLVSSSIDGADHRPLTVSTGADTEPAFSPDGRYLALRRSTPNFQDQLLLLGANGTDYVVIHVPVVGARPAWSGDSAWLAYEAPDVHGNLGIHLTTLGSGLDKLVLPGGRNPAWITR